MNVEQRIVQAAAQILMDTALRLIQEDPHQWSDRHCPTCRSISAISGKPFGCYEYQRRRKAPAPPQAAESKGEK